MTIKSSYFQGTEEPKSKKRQYKVDPLQDHNREKEDRQIKEPLRVFYRNYDYTETEGVNGPAKQGPGTGLYGPNMGKYKSVDDFRKRKQKRRAEILSVLLKQALDTPLDDVKEPNFSYAPAEPAPIGMLDGITPKSDLEDKPISSPMLYGITETHMFADDALVEDEDDEKEEPKKEVKSVPCR